VIVPANRPMDREPGILTQLAQVPAHSWRVFLICLIGVTFANFDHLLFNYVLTQISQEFGWTVTERGWYIFLTFALAGIIITRVGVLTDRLGRKRMLVATTLLTPFCVAALTWVPNTLSLVVARTFGFAFAGAQSPITITLMIEEAPARLRGLFSGVLQIGFPIGAFIASMLGAWVLTTWGWRYIFLLAFLFLPYVWIIQRYLKEPRAWVDARQAAAPDARPASIGRLFEPGLRHKTILLFLGQFLYVFAYGTTILLTAYFQEDMGWAPQDAIQTVGLSFLIGGFGYVLAACVGEFYVSRRNTIVIWSWLGGLAFAVMIWVAESWWQIIVSFSCMTFFFYGAYAVIATFIAENFPAELRATAASVAGSLAIELGFGGGPLAASYVIAAVGWQQAFTWCAIIPVTVAGFVFLMLKPVPRGTERADPPACVAGRGCAIIPTASQGRRIWGGVSCATCSGAGRTPSSAWRR
jgi:MFS family permease